MHTAKIVVYFSKNLVDKPIVYRLVKDFDLRFNILKAEIKPDDEAVMVLEIGGSKENCNKGVAYLKNEGLRVQPLSQDVHIDTRACVSCTACVPLCPVHALEKDKTTGEVRLIKEKCIVCGICVKACPYGAMEIDF